MVNIMTKKKRNENRHGFILGVISMFTWMIPVMGLIISVLGIIFSIIQRKYKNSKWQTGLILSVIGLSLSLAIFGISDLTKLKPAEPNIEDKHVKLCEDLENLQNQLERKKWSLIGSATAKEAREYERMKITVEEKKEALNQFKSQHRINQSCYSALFQAGK